MYADDAASSLRSSTCLQSCWQKSADALSCLRGTFASTAGNPPCSSGSRSSSASVDTSAIAAVPASGARDTMGGMPRRSHRFSRPVYEGLPWFYITGGIAALIASYLLASRGGWSLLTGLLGLVILVGGIVVLLRRRDYRSCAPSTRTPIRSPARSRPSGYLRALPPPLSAPGRRPPPAPESAPCAAPALSPAPRPRRRGAARLR